jgi:PKD repeat protein
MKKIICLPVLTLLYFFSFAQTWTSFGSGIPDALSGGPSVFSILEFNDTLFAGGNITTAGGITTNDSLAGWDGYGWFNAGLNTDINQLLVYNNELYAVGGFGIKKKSGAAWIDLGSGLNAGANALAVYNNHLYVGGSFTNAGGVTAYHIAQWDGANWSAVGGGCSDMVQSLVVNNNILYVFGQFTQVDGVLSVNYGAQWNTTAWSVMPGLPPTNTGAILGPAAAYQDTLYFANTSGNLYRYANDTATVFIGFSTLVSNATPVSLANLFNKLYIGLSSPCGGGVCPTALYYNGASVNMLAGGGYYFGEYNCQLVSSGNSTYSSFARLWTAPTAGFTANQVTACQGDTVTFSDTVCQGVTSRLWTFPGGTPDSSTVENPTVVYSQQGTYNVGLTIYNPVGFHSVQVANYITVTPAPAQPMITQIGNILISSASSGNQWYRNDTLLPNETTHLDTVPNNIAFYQCYSVTVSNGTCSATSDTICFSPTTTTGINNPSVLNMGIYPNPSNGEFFVRFENNTNSESQITITDILGNKVYAETFLSSVGTVTRSIKTESFAAGIYIVTLHIDDKTSNEKIVMSGY